MRVSGLQFVQNVGRAECVTSPIGAWDGISAAHLRIFIVVRLVAIALYLLSKFL